MRSLLTLLILLLLSSPTVALHAAEGHKTTVIVYFYHDMPPYVIESKRNIGLYYDFVRMLNQEQKQWQFEAQFLPRVRIEYMLNHDLLPGILLGVNPLWFKDPDKKRFYWSPAILTDQDILVSRKANKVDYQAPSSLFGKRISGIRGYYYFGISEAAETGQLKLSDNSDMKAVLDEVLKTGSDAGIVSEAFFNYTSKNRGWEQYLYAAPTPHDRFTRHLLIPQRYPELRAPLITLTEQLNKNSYWTDHVNQVMTGQYRYPP